MTLLRDKVGGGSGLEIIEEEDEDLEELEESVL